MEYETIIVERNGRVGWITLNRPDVMNALNSQVMREVVKAAEAFDADEGIGAILLTGSEHAFAAGADIQEMESMVATDVIMDRFFADWSRFAALRTPVVAAVSGYALGGGCELAMMCDIIIAADTARFGQPEITLGVVPGMGGTQRLVRAVGYFIAADLVLSARLLNADEALRVGLVSRVVPVSELLDQAASVAESIALRSLPSVYAAKEALRVALETPLAEGLRFERQAFASMFSTADQKEGMRAFLQKRPPHFTHR